MNTAKFLMVMNSPTDRHFTVLVPLVVNRKWSKAATMTTCNSIEGVALVCGYALNFSLHSTPRPWVPVWWVNRKPLYLDHCDTVSYM
jgi:hypothetical protein